MKYFHDADAEQLARARLAYVSAGQRSLSAPRRALGDADEPEPEDILPAAPGPQTWAERLVFTRTHLIAVAVVLVVIATALGFAFTRASAEVIPTVPAVESAPPPVEAPADEPTASTPVRIRVHVIGEVALPGVVTLPEGSIVADAVTAAGGLTDTAVPGDLNFAAAVLDGMQVKVGSAGDESHVDGDAAAGSGAGGGGTPGKVNLNTATAEQLEELPGVGPVMASAILAWREEHGRFTSTTELQEISGIGPKTFQKLEPMVSV